MNNIYDFIDKLRLMKETKFVAIEIVIDTCSVNNDFAQVVGVYDNFDKAHDAAIVFIAQLNDYAKKPVIVDQRNGIYIEHYYIDEDNRRHKSKIYILPIRRECEFLNK